MENLKHLSDDEIHLGAHQAAKNEMSATLALLEFLFEVQRRSIYAARGFPSMHAYAIKFLGYSETQATERVNAMRFVCISVPEAKPRVESGHLNLTSASMAERFLKKAKKVGKPIAGPLLLQKIEGKSKREVEKVFVTEVPETQEFKESVRPVDGNYTELKLYLDNETMRSLEEIELREGTMRISDALRILLKKYFDTKPYKNSHVAGNVASRNPDSRYISKGIREHASSHSGNRCEFVDEKTGRRCESKMRLQFDHRVPFAFGGQTTAENIRLLCQTHNLYEAKRVFGQETINAIIRQKTGS